MPSESGSLSLPHKKGKHDVKQKGAVFLKIFKISIGVSYLDILTFVVFTPRTDILVAIFAAV